MPEQAREQRFGAELSAVRAAANSVASSTRSKVATFKSRADQTDFDVIIVGAGLSGIGVADPPAAAGVHGPRRAIGACRQA
jgi:ribulose 1,5-bisphosphate synthetase/thiazole synthase